MEGNRFRIGEEGPEVSVISPKSCRTLPRGKPLYQRVPAMQSVGPVATARYSEGNSTPTVDLSYGFTEIFPSLERYSTYSEH